MTTRIALIAGAGRFPFHVAQEAKRQGVVVVAMGLRGWADPTLAAHVDTYEDIAVGELGRLIARLKVHGVQQAIMAGKVTKDVLFDPRASFDAETLAVLSRVKDASVTALLGAIATRLAQDGITLLDSSTYLRQSLCPIGVLTSRRPTATEEEDMRIGVEAARQLAALDIGQTVIVKGRVIVAVEALEGTDATIRRAHTLARDGLVVVKTASATQDWRFDLPVIGTETLTLARDSGVSCIAVEAGSTLLLERDALIRLANSTGIAVVGVAIPARSS